MKINELVELAQEQAKREELKYIAATEAEEQAKVAKHILMFAKLQEILGVELEFSRTNFSEVYQSKDLYFWQYLLTHTTDEVRANDDDVKTRGFGGYFKVNDAGDLELIAKKEFCAWVDTGGKAQDFKTLIDAVAYASNGWTPPPPPPSEYEIWIARIEEAKEFISEAVKKFTFDDNAQIRLTLISNTQEAMRALVKVKGYGDATKTQNAIFLDDTRSHLNLEIHE